MESRELEKRFPNSVYNTKYLQVSKAGRYIEPLAFLHFSTRDMERVILKIQNNAML